MAGVITENHSGRRVCCLRGWVRKEQVIYNSPVVTQGLEKSEKGKVYGAGVKHLCTPPTHTTKVQQIEGKGH